MIGYFEVNSLEGRYEVTIEMDMPCNPCDLSMYMIYSYLYTACVQQARKMQLTVLEITLLHVEEKEN